MSNAVNVDFITKVVEIEVNDNETESLATMAAVNAAARAEEAKDVVVDNLQDSLDAIDAKTEEEKSELDGYTEEKKAEVSTVGQGYVDSASQKVAEANTILSAIRNEYGYPFTAATAADMTDTSKIYVYVGNETGYTNGNWYYHNGDAWVSGGVYNAQALQTDKTLTVSDAAVDAKITGDAIKSTKAEMSLFGIDDILWDNTNPASKTQAGITWTVNNVSKTVTISGTVTGTSILNFVSSINDPFPSWLQKGKKYYLHYNDPTEKVYAIISYNTADQTDVMLVTTKTSTVEFVIPTSATALRIRLSTISGIAGQSISTVVKPFISESLSLSELMQEDAKIDAKIHDIGAVVPTWESGSINASTGVPYANSKHSRTAEYISVTSEEKLVIALPKNHGCRAIYYDNDYEYVSTEAIASDGVVTRTIANGVSYVKFFAYNLSDSSSDVPADYGKTIKIYRASESIYKALEYLAVRWVNLSQDTFTTTEDLPLNAFCRIERTWMDADTETLPYYGAIEYYFVTLGRQTNGAYKSQLAFDFANGIIYMRRFNVGSQSWGEWKSIKDVIQVEYDSSNLVDDAYYHLNLANVTFNKRTRLITDSGFKHMLVSVKKGDVVYLRAYGGGMNARTYAKIKYNYIIDEVYDNTESRLFVGNISFDYDGFLAINVTATQASKFRCVVKSFSMDVIENAKFVNAQTNKTFMFPDYGEDNPCRALLRGSSMMGAIHSWGIIGASFDSGEFNYTKDGNLREIEWYEYSCWNVLKALNNIPDLYIYADGGQNAKEWISLGANSVRGYAYASDTEVVNPYWSGRSGIGYGGGCWWKVREDAPKQAYLINLGSNDINNNYPFEDPDNYDETRYYKCGTIEDIGTYDYVTDTDTVPAGKTAGVIPGVVNSYCAYMGALLQRLIAKAPDCVIFLATIRNGMTANPNIYAVWNEYNDALREIAQMPQFANNVILVDWGNYGPNFATYEMRQMIVGYHPNALAYHFIAYWWNTLLDKAIFENFTRLKQSMFIGTGKNY